MSDHWRLVLSNGVVVDVATNLQTYVRGWFARCAFAHSSPGDTERDAVATFAWSLSAALESEAGLDVWVSAILAPGELTPDERVTAERERCAAIAENVAMERDSRADMAVMDRAEVRHRDVANTAREIATAIRKGV